MEMNLIQLLEEYEIGALLQQSNADLHKIARAVHSTGNTGTLTLKIKIEAEGGKAVTVSIAADAKVPRKTPFAQEMFVNDRTGQLQYGNPDQKEIQFPADEPRQTPQGDL